MSTSLKNRFGFLHFSVVGALLVMFSVMGSTARAADMSCDRACLKGVMDKYLAAMVAHDPSKAPFADNVKFTENGQVLTLHDALWATASANSQYRLYVLDPENESAGFLGEVKEHGNPAIIAVRLKVVDQKITEAEQIVDRPSANGFASPEAFKKPLPILTETLKPSEQVSREQMMEAANHYFTGLDTENTGKNVPFDPKCQRRENGTITANNPDGKGMAKMGCKAQFDTGFSAIVTDVRDRRFPVIDTRTGLVFSLVFFDHAGQVKQYTQPDGKVVKISGTFTHPLTFQIAEIFKIKSGKIRQIEAVVNQVPYKMRSGWGD
ncbi:MAG TPA: hypothetical protein VKA19_00605 [Alphaproteobacteria bacterium]|nr:hypothetical protein [Alphaproteobacteria bacterium]